MREAGQGGSGLPVLRVRHPQRGEQVPEVRGAHCRAEMRTFTVLIAVLLCVVVGLMVDWRE